jgi:DNA-binding response OmpR family regulator
MARKLGANDVLAKPIRRNDLLAKVKALLSD